MSIGTLSGSTRRGPLSRTVSQAFSMVQTPPMPVDTTAPSRSPGTSGEPASFHASRVAMIAYCAVGSMRRISVRWSTSSGGTTSCPANVTGMSYLATQSYSSVRTPERPARAPSQVEATSPPSGVVAPRPVTTTFVDVPIGLISLGAGSPRASGARG